MPFSFTVFPKTPGQRTLRVGSGAHISYACQDPREAHNITRRTHALHPNLGGGTLSLDTGSVNG